MSLRTRLVLAVLGLALLPLVLAGFVSDRSVESAFRKDLGTSFTRRAADSSDKVARSLQDAQHALETWASLSFMQEVLTDDLTARSRASSSASPASTRRSRASGPEDDGRVRLGERPALHRQAQDRELARALEGQLSLGDAHYSEADSQWVVTFAAPIQLEGSVVGVLLGKWKADELSAITQVGSQGESVGVYVLRKDGLVLAGPNPAERYKRNVEAEGAESAARAVKGQQGFVEERLRGRSVLSGFSPFQSEGALASLGWAVLVTQDEAVAFAPIRKMRGWMGGIALALALVIVPLTVLLGRQITGPVIDISRAAQRVARGDFEARVTQKTNDEIGALAKAFNDMTTDLASQRAELVDKHYVDSILASMLDTLVVLDAKGMIKTVNRATTDLLFYEEGDLLGQPGHVLRPTPEDAERLVATIREKRSFSAPDFSYRTKWGGTVPVSLSASVMRGEKGDARGIVCIAKDITDLKRQQEELREAKEAAEQANRTKSQFLANMSHELRTPLNAIIGYSEMLYEEAQEDGEVSLTSDLRKIQSAGKHLLALINDILDLSKIEAGKMELYLEVVDIGALVEDTVVTIEPLVQKNGNILDVGGRRRGPQRPDVTRLRQVLFNLLSNASKFTNKGPHRALGEEGDGRGPRGDGVRGEGHRHRPHQGAHLPALPGLRAGRLHDDPQVRRHGSRLVISRRFCQIMVETSRSRASTGTARRSRCAFRPRPPRRR
jgi:PAS domain S-box-containing protein